MKYFASSAVALTVLAGAGHATTVTDTASVASTRTDWTASVALDQFDAALGTLNSVTLTVVGYVDGSAVFDNGADNAETITANLSAEITATGPSMSFSVTVMPIGKQSVTLGADEGEATPDFMGSDSAAIKGVMGTDSDSDTLFGGFGAYIGAGTFTVDFAADATSSVSGGGNIAAIFETFAAADVTVIYDYTPAAVPLPAGFPLLIAGAGSLLALRRRAK